MDIFSDKIEPLMRARGLSDTDFEKALSLPRSTVYDWRKKRSRSFRKYLPEIALKLGVTVGFLLSNEPIPDLLLSPHCEYRNTPLPPELMEKLDCTKREFEAICRERQEKLASFIANSNLTIAQLDMIERMIGFICEKR